MGSFSAVVLGRLDRSRTGVDNGVSGREGVSGS